MLAAHLLKRGGPYGPYARLPVSLSTVNLPSSERSGVFFSASSGVITPPSATGVVRAAIERTAPGVRRFPVNLAHDGRRGLVNFSFGQVSIEAFDGAVPIEPLRHSPIPNMHRAPDMFQADMFSPALAEAGEAAVPLLYGEELDVNGAPLRWNRPADSMADKGIFACSGVDEREQALLRRLIQGLSVPASGEYFTAQAKKYKGAVKRYAEKYSLPSALVLAIMHTESNFNPFAVSRSRAVGLMQIVPDTAGNEVHRYLTGIHGTPSLETLFTPEHNIRYGTAYLYLLAQRYFGGVHNAAARQMCMIAAYNGGPGAVLRMFDSSDQEAAVARINTLTPEQVYRALTTQMPSAETRRYVELVLGRMRNYSSR